MSTADDSRLLDLARRLLSGEAIDWTKEGIAETEVREGMKRLQQVIGRPDDLSETVGATATPAPSPRSREGGFIGPFRIVRKLGEGGMGVVYEAEQQRPRRLVALKVIRGGHYVDDNALRLFQREIQTLLTHTMGKVYATLAILDRAGALLDRGLEIQSRLSGTSSLEYADLMDVRGLVAACAGDLVRGLDMIECAGTIRARRLRDDDPRLARGLWRQGLVLANLGREGAEARLQRALQLVERAPQRDERLLAAIVQDIGAMYLTKGNCRESLEHYRRALAIRERILPADHPDRIGTTNNLGWTLVLCGDLANARPYLERASSEAERIHGPRNPFTSTIVHSLGELELRAGRYDRARSLLERALIASQVEGTDTPFSIDPLSSLGHLAELTGDFAGAESFLRRSLLLQEKLRGPQHPTLRDTLESLASVLEKRGDRRSSAELRGRAQSLDPGSPVLVNVVLTSDGLLDTDPAAYRGRIHD